MNTALLLAGLALAGLMGFAIQRGGTCTVAAVDEIVAGRGCTRLLAMLEAALWVLGGLLIWQALHGLDAMPAGYPVGGATIAGGALLGLGAYLNRACVFGAIARFGSGEWVYAFTPVGFYLGCLAFGALASAPPPRPLDHGSIALGHSALWIAPFAAFMGWRLLRPWLGAPRTRPLPAEIARHVWSPRAATAVIGIAFLLLLLVAGAWAYTDVLAELARDALAAMTGRRGLLLLALWLGAVLGGVTGGLWRHDPITPLKALRCTAGGMLMAWGSLLIPGGNDGLILLGMPLLWPYAWVAFLAMCASVAAALLLQRRLGAQ